MPKQLDSPSLEEDFPRVLLGRHLATEERSRVQRQVKGRLGLLRKKIHLNICLFLNGSYGVHFKNYYSHDKDLCKETKTFLMGRQAVL